MTKTFSLPVCRKLSEGEKYGDLIFTGEKVREGKKYMGVFLCCACGKKSAIRIDNVVSGKQKSCRCRGGENHGHTTERIYYIWSSMKQRVTNKKRPRYPEYGGKGIGIQESWLDFRNFYQDMKDGYREDLTLDRIDNSKGYSKENCRWATIIQQQRNKNNNRIIEYRGEKKCLAEWCEVLKLPYDRIKWRIRRGWSAEDAFNKPRRGSLGKGSEAERYILDLIK